MEDLHWDWIDTLKAFYSCLDCTCKIPDFDVRNKVAKTKDYRVSPLLRVKRGFIWRLNSISIVTEDSRHSKSLASRGASRT